tara:strand:- start:19948 stop:20196 length:249 start_codon:yes stop_codon:yes gene_type:complete
MKAIDFFNLRVFKHVEENGKVWYAIHTAYYSNEDKENPHSFGDIPLNLTGHNLEDLEGLIDQINTAYEKPVLEVEEFNKKRD